MITPTQMRAARAMLDVSQGHVAQYLGIAANTLSKIESGQSDVSGTRLTDIQRFYEREGVEFTSDDGVKWAKNQVVKYEGQQGIREFFDTVYEEFSNGNEVNLFNGVPLLLIKWLGTSYYEIVEEGENNFIAKGFAEYRWFPKEMFNNKTIYIFNNQVAFFTFKDDDVSIRVFKNAELGASMKVLFNIAWEKVARIPE